MLLIEWFVWTLFLVLFTHLELTKNNGWQNFLLSSRKKLYWAEPFWQKSHCLHILIYCRRKKTLHFMYHGLVTTVLVILFITITSKVQNYQLPWLHFIFFCSVIQDLLFESKGHCKSSAYHKSLDMPVRNSSPGFCLSLTLNLIDHLECARMYWERKNKIDVTFWYWT